MEQELLEIVKQANRIWKHEIYSDRLKYDLIFSNEISVWVQKTFRSFEWCDPDTSYEEDVDAFMHALNDFCGVKKWCGFSEKNKEK